jgi:hypothetical protein
VVKLRADCNRCKVFPICIVDATKFTLVYFAIELRQFLVRQKYRSLGVYMSSDL